MLNEEFTFLHYVHPPSPEVHQSHPHSDFDQFYCMYTGENLRISFLIQQLVYEQSNKPL